MMDNSSPKEFEEIYEERVVYDENMRVFEWLADQLLFPMLKRWMVIWFFVFIIGVASAIW